MPPLSETTTPDAPITDAIAEHASKAVQSAYRKAKEAGLPVVVAEGDTLVRIDVDGHKTVIKQLPPKQTPERRSLIIR